MEDILGRLFYGDYSAFEDISVIHGSGESIHHRCGEITTQLKALVPGDNFKLIEELLGSLYQTQTEDLKKAFKAGVRLGAQFVAAACLPDGVSGQGRQLRHNGAFSNKSCGLHIHVSAAPFNARTLRNLTNIMYSKEDILYRALQVDVAREYRYCKKTDQQFIFACTVFPASVGARPYLLVSMTAKPYLFTDRAS